MGVMDDTDNRSARVLCGEGASHMAMAGDVTVTFLADELCQWRPR